MDLNVINGVIRAIGPAVLGYAVGKGWIPQSSVSDIITILTTLAAAIWSVTTNMQTKAS